MDMSLNEHLQTVSLGGVSPGRVGASGEVSSFQEVHKTWHLGEQEVSCLSRYFRAA